MIADQLLQAIGHASGLNTLRFNPQGCARLLIDGTLSVQLEHNEAEDLIHLYSSLGAVPPTGRETLFRELLEANLFGHATSGATLALDKLHNDIVVWQSVPVSSTTTDDMLSVMESFVSTAESWQNRLSQIFTPGSLQDPIQPHGTASAGAAMRV